MNVIAPPKTGKSWFVIDLAIAIASGKPWLGRYATTQGQVLILDNELHPETSADRIPKVAVARGIPIAGVELRIDVDNMRGRLCDVHGLMAYFDAIEPGTYQMIILDAFYRFLPEGVEENSNAEMARIYNSIDRIADRLGCCFVLIHHASKGNQSSKSVTDVGAGAGAQSRAADTHLVLRPHDEEDVVVLDAAARSWPPLGATCLRWSFPVWEVDQTLDPNELRSARSSKKKGLTPPKRTWRVEEFVSSFLGERPQCKAEIRTLAAEMDDPPSGRKIDDLLKAAVARGLAFRSSSGGNRAAKFATIPQPIQEALR